MITDVTPLSNSQLHSRIEYLGEQLDKLQKGKTNLSRMEKYCAIMLNARQAINELKKRYDLTDEDFDKHNSGMNRFFDNHKN